MPTMKAAVLTGFNQPLEIQDVTLDDPGPGQVLVKTAATGLCHSDLHFIEGKWKWPLPAVLGHEAAGIVKQVGEGVTKVKPGDHVVLLWVPSCGECEFCRSDRPYLCQRGHTFAQTLHLGDQAIAPFVSMSSFAEYMVAPEKGLVKIRGDMPLDKASLVGCSVMTGVGAARNTANVQSADTCAVIGCGGVGLNVIQGCALAHAEQIIAVDIHPKKLEMAREFGATHVVDASSEEDVVKKVQELAGGGVDHAFEVIGRPESITDAFSMAKRGGEAIVVGMAPMGSTVSLRADEIMMQAKRIQGCHYGDTTPWEDMPHLIDLYMTGELKLDQLVSRTISLGEINEGFEAMKGGEVARSVVVFD